MLHFPDLPQQADLLFKSLGDFRVLFECLLGEGLDCEFGAVFDPCDFINGRADSLTDLSHWFIIFPKAVLGDPITQNSVPSDAILIF